MIVDAVVVNSYLSRNLFLRCYSNYNKMTATHRKRCLEQTDPVCLCCEADSSLDIHHVDGNPTNDELDNLVVLCKSCHRKVHSKQRENATMSMLVDQLGKIKVPELDPEDFDDVASTATLTIKETAPGHKYYYWQWNQDGKLHSKYAAPVDDCSLEYIPPSHIQTNISEWCSTQQRSKQTAE